MKFGYKWLKPPSTSGRLRNSFHAWWMSCLYNTRVRIRRQEHWILVYPAIYPATVAGQRTEKTPSELSGHAYGHADLIF